jgi:diaminohydroxyphosphoribosylaminopyrimidine deaminase/5-amino-6-(5-phosphoribosylamino)uracil reductase
MPDETDARFLAAAIRLGRGALGTTWPSPAVGAILVKDGKVVGRGRTAPGGRPHAEVQAIAEAGEAARGATLYVSLEPCSHQGRGAPCADAILAAGISRVAMPIADPDPRVAGGGMLRLQAAGVEVVSGALAKEAERAHAGHLSRMKAGRPHVVLKLAVSADDAIGRVGEAGVAVTGENARRHVQALRSRFDAIMVGRGTVEADDPALTCRLPGLEKRSPVRVVVDSEAKLDGRWRVFDGPAQTWVFSVAGLKTDSATSDTPPLTPPHLSSPEQSSDFAQAGKGEGDSPAPDAGQNVRRFRVAGRRDGGVELEACLRMVAAEGVTRVLVEGGAKIARSLLEADLLDEAIIFRSPKPLGGELVPALAGLPLSAIEASRRFRVVERLAFSTDRMTRYERAR